MATQNWSTSNYLGVESSLVTGYPFTMAAWFNSNSSTANQAIITLNRSASDADAAGLAINGSTGGDPVQAYYAATGPFYFANSSAAYTTNTWQHACGVFSSSTLRTAYLDGGNSGTNTTSATWGTAPGRTSVGVYRSSGVSAGFSGFLAEVCIWTAALDASEVASLAKGVSPLLVRPQSLVHYLPMIRTAAQDLKGTTWTTTGSVNELGEHPRMYYPADMFASGRSASGFRAWLAAQVNQTAGVVYA